MELRDYIRILRKHVLLILVCTILGLAASAAYTFTRVPMFESTSKVFVSAQGAGNIAEVQQGASFSQARVATYVNLVTTETVLGPVIAELDLDITAEELTERISASAPVNTLIISITVEDPNAAKAASISNALAESLRNAVNTTEAPTDGGTSPVRLTQVENALIAEHPSSPRVPVNLALGLLVGLALGVGFAVLREVLDTRIHNADDIEQITDAPILGGITYDPKASERPLIVQDDPRSPRAESFRALRTSLQFIEYDGRKSFVVTSSVQSEGKSTTTTNLALTMAEAGLDVMLIDADMRRPKLDAYLGLEGGAGLSDILAGRAELGDVVQHWTHENLSVLMAGTMPPNPSELLASDNMAELLETLESGFDVVLIDMPPLLPVTDAAIVAKQVGGAIVVAAVGRTARAQLESSLSILEQVGARVAGIVLNMIPTKGVDAYGYGRYGYSQYGYGVKETKPAKSVLARLKKRS